MDSISNSSYSILFAGRTTSLELSRRFSYFFWCVCGGGVGIFSVHSKHHMDSSLSSCSSPNHQHKTVVINFTALIGYLHAIDVEAPIPIGSLPRGVDSMRLHVVKRRYLFVSWHLKSHHVIIQIFDTLVDSSSSSSASPLSSSSSSSSRSRSMGWRLSFVCEDCSWRQWQEELDNDCVTILSETGGAAVFITSLDKTHYTRCYTLDPLPEEEQGDLEAWMSFPEYIRYIANKNVTLHSAVIHSRTLDFEPQSLDNKWSPILSLLKQYL
jgi:hypothetical protein